ncbi:LysR family transcriptional regulator [Solirhodobacter olei]|uniref:LysR family transcriptional regulator n=1 Tax=Solirhodobacter olei TaxID=2493082 RepID=UPI000FD8229C|nr:LysR family transcriptional regulator [Solirhodobacter olei]
MIDKLEMFLALARERHFGRAAEACGVTQPTLSVAIRQLEEQLGVMLVWRGSRYGGLTPEGQRVLEWARKIVSDSRTMREEMRAARQGLSGRIRLGVIPTALTVASQLTMAFAKRHPNVRFTILSRSSIEILDMVENLEIDAGVTYLDNEPLGHVTTQPLYRERYTLVCAPGHILFERHEVNWAEVGVSALCLLTPDMQNRRIIDQQLAAAGVTAGPVVESNSTVAIIAHVMSGNWATILPTKLAEFHARGKKLRMIPIREPDVEHIVGLIAPHREPHTPVLAALMQEAGGISE